jgi:uncharacterized Zn finger protein (UPF0148 family)
LPECPRCGTKAYVPKKIWAMVGRPSRTGERFKLTIGLFTCPKCEKGFREVLGKEKERATLKGVANEIKGIERSLAHTLGDLKDKIEKLKLQKSELLNEIEELKRAGQEKADTLEKEVASLREEVESLKEMLGNY